MTEREALKLAFEALEDISSHYMSLPKKGCMALAAIEEALAEQETVLPGGGHVPAVPVAVYGYCPECGGAGVMRERRPNGDDKCTNGHKYPSSKALAEQPAQQQEPVAHSVVAGALFDFMGWLTSRKERIVLSSADNASPAVRAITEFAKMRNLSLDDAKVQDWNTTPPQPESVIDKSAAVRIATALGWEPKRKPLTEPELHAINPTWPAPGQEWGYEEVLAFARAIEAAHGIKEQNT